MRSLLVVLLGAAVAACGSSSEASPDAAPVSPVDAAATVDAAPPPPDTGPDAVPAPDAGDPGLARDILNTDLSLDVTALTGTATVTVAPGAPSTLVALEAGGLTISSVTDSGGNPLAHVMNGKILDVTVPDSADPVAITVDYTFKHSSNGFLGGGAVGSTLIWPYFCGNLFPCHSDPADGTTFTLAVTGVPAADVAVYPTTLAIAPSYQIAFAVGPYTELDLGTTDAGTTIKTWYRTPGEMANVMMGTLHLPEVFDWYQKKWGDYSFGSEFGVVPVTFNLGGMEHHPYVHITTSLTNDPNTAYHESAHGWFGDGVRIECWEDFLLSEGTVVYIAARAQLQFDGQDAYDATWASNLDELMSLETDPTVVHKQAWFPETCNAIDIEQYFTDIPYMKGAFFYRAVENKVGVAMLDAALADFYQHHVGTAARFQDMLDTIQRVTGYDPTACAIAWLRSDALPDDLTTCP